MIIRRGPHTEDPLEAYLMGRKSSGCGTMYGHFEERGAQRRKFPRRVSDTYGEAEGRRVARMRHGALD